MLFSKRLMARSVSPLLEGQLGFLVALHRGLEVAKRVLFSPDPRPLFLFEPVEGRRLTRGPIRPPKMSADV